MCTFLIYITYVCKWNVHEYHCWNLVSVSTTYQKSVSFLFVTQMLAHIHVHTGQTLCFDHFLLIKIMFRIKRNRTRNHFILYCVHWNFCLKYKKFCQSQVLGSFRQSSIVLTYRMFEFYTKWSRFRSVSKISATQHLCQFWAMFKGISLAFINSSSHLNTSQNVLYYIKFD